MASCDAVLVKVVGVGVGEKRQKRNPTEKQEAARKDHEEENPDSLDYFLLIANWEIFGRESFLLSHCRRSDGRREI